MQEESNVQATSSPELLPYHAALRDFLKQSESDVWQWFTSRRMLPKAWDEVRFDLLKTAYRVERSDQAELYAAADEVAAKLGITAPITIYQAQNPHGNNASLAFIPDEVHLVLHGPIASELPPHELKALLAHELAHHLLWSGGDGEMHIAFDVLNALATDPQSHPAHHETYRLYRLYAEVFCDRIALMVTGDLYAVIAALIKVETSVNTVNAESFLRQADEIFAHPDVKTDGLTHPESYIRARALRLWSEHDANYPGQIMRMIEGPASMDQLDLLAQQRLASATRQLLDTLFSRRWLCTDLLLAHAKLFFDDFIPTEGGAFDAGFVAQLKTAHSSVRDYFAYVLLDFVAAERDLGEPLVAAVLTLAEQLDIKPRLLELLRQELKLRKTQLDKIDDRKESILTEAERALVAS